LNKVYTNGTLVDEELLTDEQAGHCVSLREAQNATGESTFGVCVLDSATSEFGLSAFDDDVCRTKLETLLRQLRPKEIIFTKVRVLIVMDWSSGIDRNTGLTVCVDDATVESNSALCVSLD
jgi:DNA mismatch repair ATPase MutS